MKEPRKATKIRAAWAIFKAWLGKPWHKGTYMIVLTYHPTKKKYGHMALRVPKR